MGRERGPIEWPVTPVLAGGVVIALQVFAGHTQELYLSGLAAGVYALSRPGRLRRIAGLAAMVAIGLGLAALQLLPTLELSTLSIRSGGLSSREAVSFSLPPWRLPEALLPEYTRAPFAEFSASVGLVGMALMAVALVRAPARRVAIWAALAAGAVILALGGFTPVYWVALKVVPGLSLFRVPARFLYLYSFAAAMLVGIGLHTIEGWRSGARGRGSGDAGRTGYCLEGRVIRTAQHAEEQLAVWAGGTDA